MKLLIASFSLLVLSQALAAPRVDLKDLRDFTASSQNYDQLIRAFNYCSDCWPRGVRYLPYGADRNADFTHNNVVFWTTVKSQSGSQFKLTSLYRLNSQIFIRQSEVSFDGGDVRLISSTDTSANSNAWKIEVRGVEKELFLENKDLDFALVIPIVVGGFDITETKLKLPPTNTYASTIDAQGANANLFSRTQPAYYQGYPFVKLLNTSGYYTAYGIHAPMDPGAMKRGFWSTGCIRVRIMDLYPIYYLVDFLNGKKLQVTSRTFASQNSDEHPYPEFTSGYKRVNKEKPMGSDGLSNMEIVEGAPPLQNL